MRDLDALWLVFAMFFGLYSLIALGRIWLYSKRQVELLTAIQAALTRE